MLYDLKLRAYLVYIEQDAVMNIEYCVKQFTELPNVHGSSQRSVEHDFSSRGRRHLPRPPLDQRLRLA